MQQRSASENQPVVIGAGMSRRDAIRVSAGVLAGAAAVGVAGSTPALGQVGALQVAGAGPRRVLRIAHLTDVHVQSDREAGLGFATAMRHVQEQSDKPQMVLFGGDNLMNVDGSDGAATADQQLGIWRKSLKDELSLSHRACVGNHDIYRMAPVDGKKWAVDALEIPARYYTFDQAGWRFIVLDSTSPEGGGYKGRIDNEQFEWLEGVLKGTPQTMPVLVISHIPIIAACAYFDGENEKTGDWVVPGSWMHIDARRLKDLFARHPRVRVCISGHMHLVDQVTYNGVSYCCNGAVSGAWWDGAYHECETGYGLIDLFEDGTFRNQYVTYPWTPRK